MVAELTMDYSPHERARAFSLLPLMFGLGGIIGPILGGFLSHPVTNFPSVFGNLGSVTQFLTDFPYFLPCAISAFVCILGLIFGLFFLEESHACFRRNAKDDEEEPLLSDSTKYMTFESENQPNAKSQSPTPTLYDSPPTLKESITPAVLAICITFAVFSFQGVYMDGKLYTDIDILQKFSVFKPYI
jgi:MFS family permease